MKQNFWATLKEYLTIYWTMFVIGICTFGGGYAMTAIIQRELGEKKKWIDEDELLDYIAISQITPGVIAVNISTFVGRKRKGVLGAIAATIGVVTPSIIIIMIIAAVLTNFADNEYVKHAFAGIRVCVIALIINAVVGFLKKTVVDWLTLLIFLGVFAVAAFTTFGTVYIVLCVIVLGVILTIIQSAHPIPGVKMQGISGKKNSQDKNVKADSNTVKMQEKQDKIEAKTEKNEAEHLENSPNSMETKEKQSDAEVNFPETQENIQKTEAETEDKR